MVPETRLCVLFFPLLAPLEDFAVAFLRNNSYVCVCVLTLMYRHFFYSIYVVPAAIPCQRQYLFLSSWTRLLPSHEKKLASPFNPVQICLNQSSEAAITMGGSSGMARKVGTDLGWITQGLVHFWWSWNYTFFWRNGYRFFGIYSLWSNVITTLFTDKITIEEIDFRNYSGLIWVQH